jgi:4-hydroxy-tetrahydrodipicolinate synthase
MDRDKVRAGLTGCYIPMPTLLREGDLELNLEGMKRHVRFLLNHGVRQGNGVLLVCGAAGDFTTLDTQERLRIAEAVLEAAAGKVGVVLGVQSTNLREVIALARGAERLGALAVQASPPFYHHHSDDDVCDFLGAVAEASDIPIVLYTTYWQGKLSLDLVGRLAEIRTVAALKWAAPTFYEFERGLRRFAAKHFLIDNALQFVLSHMMGARGINTHPSNYWPEWGIRLWELLEAGQYRQAQEEMTRVLFPYYDLAYEIEHYTGGEGHLDKLCLELIGLDSSRSRLPIRDIRSRYREPVRHMLRTCGVPHLR